MHDNPNQPPAMISPSDAAKMTENACLEEEAKISAAVTEAVKEAALKRQKSCQVEIAKDMANRAVALAKAAGYAQAHQCTHYASNGNPKVQLQWP